MYIIHRVKLGVKLILTTDPFDCAQDRFHGSIRQAQDKFSQIQRTLLPQRIERGRGTRDEGRGGRGGNGEFGISNFE